MKPDQNHTTFEYYQTNAEEFAQGTKDVDLSELYAPFLEFLPASASILDAGCGSGRDTRFFTQNGFDVTAFDYSPEMVRLASHLTGRKILLLSFNEITFSHQFDGVWACASILHVPMKNMADVLLKLGRSLKSGGILYTSYKHGEGEFIREGRLFIDFSEASFRKLLTDVPILQMVRHWDTSDLRPGRENEKWFNVLLRKA